MASTGKKGKKNKGKTLPLNDFLLTPTKSWSDQVDEAERFDYNRKPALPDAPRAARAIDESLIAKNPPYIAYLSNLSFDVDEKDINNAFVDLNIANVTLPREENLDKIKGFGYVEFNDKMSFIDALLMSEVVIKRRRVKIEVADMDGDRHRGPRGGRDRDGNFEHGSDWRAGSRLDYMSNDKRGSTNRRDYSFRDRDNFRDRDVPDRGRSSFGDRETNWRDSERRFTNDREYRSSFGGRRNFDDRNDSNQDVKTRTKLQLQPRTLPIGEVVVKEEKDKKDQGLSASIFGQAKPVDTAAREMQIEERLQREKQLTKTDFPADKQRPRSEDSRRGSVDSRRGDQYEEQKDSDLSRERDDGVHSSSEGFNNGQVSDAEDAPSNQDVDGDRNRDISDDQEKGDDRKNDESENDKSDGEGRYSRSNRSESRYNDKYRENDKSYRRDDRDRRDRDRRDDKDRRDYDRRDRGYDSEGRGRDYGGRYQDRERDRERDRDRDRERERDRDRDGDKRYNERDVDSRRYGDKDADVKKYSDRDGESKRYQEREGGRHREQDDHGNNRRNDKRTSAGGDGGARPGRGGPPEKDRLPPAKDRPKDTKKTDDAPRMPKFKEAAAPNYVGTNKYCCLQEDGASE